MRIVTKKQENKYKKQIDDMILDLKLDIDYEKGQTKIALEQVNYLIKENKRLEKYNNENKEELARTKIDLIDTRGFLEQEKQCSNALRKERTKLRKMITKLGGEWKDGTKKGN